MAISERSAAEILAQCARHCCICRRFRPLHLQVHHIIERAEGGSDELDNLIAICVTCHSDVHTNTRLTRRFTVQELKLHRDAVYRLVSEGKLPAGEHIGNEAIESLSAAIVEQLRVADSQQQSNKEAGLSADSMQILLAAVCEESPVQFKPIQYIDPPPEEEMELYFYVRVGGQGFGAQSDKDGIYPEPITELLNKGLIDKDGENFKVTHAGFTLVDGLVSSRHHITLKKVICHYCFLHFIICTWYPDKHNIFNLHCPECGQNEFSFSIWQQREFGFIYELVPGNAQEFQMGPFPNSRES